MRQLKPCGTQAAYRRHISRREIACEPCLAAERRRARLARARPADRTNVLFRELLELISGECKRAGLLS